VYKLLRKAGLVNRFGEKSPQKLLKSIIWHENEDILKGELSKKGVESVWLSNDTNTVKAQQIFHETIPLRSSVMI
jgi:hypothetical protein